MSEQASRETFKNHVKRDIPGAHLQRLEDRFHSGIPDINICIPGNGEWWVEAKYIKALPKWTNSPVRVPIRKEQVLWLRNRKRAGGQVLILVRIGVESWAVFDDHFERLEEGIPVESFFQLAKWHGAHLDVKLIFDAVTHSLA